MKKLFVWVLEFLLLLTFFESLVYASYHLVYKQDVFNEWVEYSSYIAAFLAACGFVYKINDTKN